MLQNVMFIKKKNYQGRRHGAAKRTIQNSAKGMKVGLWVIVS